MRRTASEVIRNLESRIAKLEESILERQEKISHLLRIVLDNCDSLNDWERSFVDKMGATLNRRRGIEPSTALSEKQSRKLRHIIYRRYEDYKHAVPPIASGVGFKDEVRRLLKSQPKRDYELERKIKETREFELKKKKRQEKENKATKVLHEAFEKQNQIPLGGAYITTKPNGVMVFEYSMKRLNTHALSQEAEHYLKNTYEVDPSKKYAIKLVDSVKVEEERYSVPAPQGLWRR
jgi:hypothetical protein